MPHPIRKAVIPTAGLATRLRPATRVIAKAMLPIVDTPALQIIVEEAIESGIDEVIVVVGHGRDQIERHFADDPRVRFVEQREPRGLGHAVLQARPLIGDEPFAVMLGDAIVVPAEGDPPATRQVIDAFDRVGHSVVAVETIATERIGSVGVVDVEPEGGGIPRVRGLIEKPSPDQTTSRLAVACRYAFTAEILERLAATTPGHGGEIQLTDAMNALARAGAMHALPWTARRYDVGNPVGYAECFVEFALRRGDTAEAARAAAERASCST